MDATAYCHFANQLRERMSVPPPLPAALPVRPELGLPGVCRFLERIDGALDKRGTGGAPALPAALDLPAEAFGFQLARTALRNLIERLTSDTAASERHPFGRTAAELTSLLSRCVQPRGVPLLGERDPLSLAAACFLLEAFMHTGWCPSGFECYAKRAAHLYFVLCRKALVHADTESLQTIHGLIWSAWVLAQKTEGIAECKPDTETSPAVHRYLLEIHGAKADLFGFHGPHEETALLLPVTARRITHPIHCLDSTAQAGMQLWIDGSPLQPIELLDLQAINRLKHQGAVAAYRCRSASGVELDWTVAVERFMQTIYRIDVVKARTGCSLSRVELRLETPGPLTASGHDSFRHASRAGQVVSFVKNPCGLTLQEPQPSGLACFASSRPLPCPPDAPVETITAWKRGNEVSAIDQTHLTGIWGS